VLLVIEQAIYGTQSPGGYQFLARSPGFHDDWLPWGLRLCTGFGDRPAGVSCPGCVFAQPFGPDRVAIVQAADQGVDDTGRPGALGFRLLIVPRTLYHNLDSDPFFVAEQFPPPWWSRGELPVLEWPEDRRPARRTIADVQRVLNVPNSPTLLGGVQALLDGGRLAFERNQPDPQLVRSLWTLLPSSSRGDLWPASFAFSNAHGFHVVVVPRVNGDAYTGYIFEEQAGDYPEGQYELALQTAAESGDQADLDALFARRSRAQTLRLAVGLLAVFLLVPLVGLLLGSFRQPAAQPGPGSKETSKTERGIPGLPGPAEFTPMADWEPEKLAQALAALGKARGLPPPRGSSAAALTDAFEALDGQLGTPDPERDPGKLGRPVFAAHVVALAASRQPLTIAAGLPASLTGRLRDEGPVKRQLRVLLWKHHVDDYNNRQLNTLELLERLEQKLPPPPGHAEKGS
jgi:hypothetical protein